MGKEEKVEGYHAASIVESTRQGIVDEAGQEVGLYDVLAEIRNDIKELKKNLIGKS